MYSASGTQSISKNYVSGEHEWRCMYIAIKYLLNNVLQSFKDILTFEMRHQK